MERALSILLLLSRGKTIPGVASALESIGAKSTSPDANAGLMRRTGTRFRDASHPALAAERRTSSAPAPGLGGTTLPVLTSRGAYLGQGIPLVSARTLL